MPLAVGHRVERGAHSPLAVGHHLVQWFTGQSGEALGPDRVGTYLSVEIAVALGRGAGVGHQDRLHLGREAYRRDSQALGEDLGGIGGDRTRRGTTDIGMMGPIGHPTHERTLGEARCHESDVVEVGTPLERIVEDDLVVRGDRRAEVLDGGAHGGRHRAQVHRNVLRLHQ